jgi:transcriptional regulator with XRE-family HTH domain
MIGSELNTGMSLSSVRLGIIIRDIRMALRWSQRDLSLRSGVSQSWVCEVERGRAADVTLSMADRLLAAMGAELNLHAAAPFLAESRQRDPAHSQCAAHVARRLEAAGWRVATEVEIGSNRSKGWVDILAWHPITRAVLMIEVNTEMRDLGSI